MKNAQERRERQEEGARNKKEKDNIERRAMNLTMQGREGMCGNEQRRGVGKNRKGWQPNNRSNKTWNIRRVLVQDIFSCEIFSISLSRWIYFPLPTLPPSPHSGMGKLGISFITYITSLLYFTLRSSLSSLPTLGDGREKRNKIYMLIKLLFNTIQKWKSQRMKIHSLDF
jgi:hypothetical protein